MSKPKPPPKITADWVLERVVEKDGCLVWAQQCCNGGRDPRAQIKGEKVNVRRAIWAAMHGRLPKDSHAVVATCATPGCCEPSHLSEKSRSAVLTGHPVSLVTRAKIAAAKAKLDKLPKHAIGEVLASPLKGEDEAKRWGMCKSSINKIRARTMRRDYSSPFAGLGA